MADANTLAIQVTANVESYLSEIARAQALTGSAMQGITSAVSLAKGAMGALGVATSALGFAEMIKGTLESQSALYELSKRTGESASMLSALRPIAKQSSTDMDTVASMVQKLTKNLLEYATTGGGKAAQAFQAIGVSQKDAQLGLKDMDSFLPAFAKKLVDTGTASEQVALAMIVMGKGGANALPFINALAEALKLHATNTQAGIEAAHQFKVSLAKLSQGSELLKISLANEMLPALNRITTAMLEARKAGEGFWASMFAGAQAVLYSDRQVNDRMVTELTQKKLNIEQQIANLRSPDNPGLEDRIPALQKELALVEAQLKTQMAYRAELEKGAAAEDKANEKKPAGKLNMPDPAASRLRAQLLAEDAANLRANIDAQTSEWDNFYKTSAEAAEASAKRKQAAEQATADMWARSDLKRQQVIHDTEAAADKKLADEAKKAAEWGKQVGLTFSSAFEDAIARGKSFSDVLKAIDQDIAKIIIRKAITEPMGAAISQMVGGSGIGNFFSNMFSSDQPVQLAGPRAAGGPVSAGSAYLVGEQGPEIFSPGASGTITPNSAMGGDTNFHMHVSLTSLDPRGALQVIAPLRDTLIGWVNNAYASRGKIGPLNR